MVSSTKSYNTHTYMSFFTTSVLCKILDLIKTISKTIVSSTRITITEMTVTQKRKPCLVAPDRSSLQKAPWADSRTLSTRDVTTPGNRPSDETLVGPLWTDNTPCPSSPTRKVVLFVFFHSKSLRKRK